MGLVAPWHVGSSRVKIEPMSPGKILTNGPSEKSTFWVSFTCDVIAKLIWAQFIKLKYVLWKYICLVWGKKLFKEFTLSLIYLRPIHLVWKADGDGIGWAIKLFNSYSPKCLIMGRNAWHRSQEQLPSWATCFTSDIGEEENNSLLPWFVGEGNGSPLQYSRLENPMDGEAW